jgi:hypothetical protein
MGRKSTSSNNVYVGVLKASHENENEQNNKTKGSIQIGKP